MDILKTSLRIALLVILCVPIACFECYIVKNTVNDVINNSKKKSSRSNNIEKNNYGKEYLKIAK